MLQLLQMQTFIYLQSKLYFWDTMWKETKLKLLIHKELLYMPKCSPGATKKWIKSNETRHQAHEMKRVVQRGGAQRELFGKRNKLSMHPSIDCSSKWSSRRLDQKMQRFNFCFLLVNGRGGIVLTHYANIICLLLRFESIHG